MPHSYMLAYLENRFRRGNAVVLYFMNIDGINADAPAVCAPRKRHTIARTHIGYVFPYFKNNAR